MDAGQQFADVPREAYSVLGWRRRVAGQGRRGGSSFSGRHHSGKVRPVADEGRHEGLPRVGVGKRAVALGVGLRTAGQDLDKDASAPRLVRRVAANHASRARPVAHGGRHAVAQLPAEQRLEAAGEPLWVEHLLDPGQGSVIGEQTVNHGVRCGLDDGHRAVAALVGDPRALQRVPTHLVHAPRPAPRLEDRLDEPDQPVKVGPAGAGRSSRPARGHAALPWACSAAETQVSTVSAQPSSWRGIRRPADRNWNMTS